MPRILLAGTHSGCGKTTITCGILAAFQARGLATVAFKCGPDYIDPMFHRAVSGIAAYNLDAFFLDGPGLCRHLAEKAGSSLGVLEGVMGYYDGIGLTDAASTYEVAKLTTTPAVLVIDAKGMSNSVGALLQGFGYYRQDSGIRGVIFNQINDAMYRRLEPLAAAQGLVPLGYLPPQPDLRVASRHLGLITAKEIPDLQRKLARLGELAENCLDLDRILDLAAMAPTLIQENATATATTATLADANADGSPSLAASATSGPIIAVARDEAFCFLYAENLALLEELGCSLAYFSPLHDERLPQDIAGLYLPGGYPELYAAGLAANQTMMADIAGQIRAGLPTIAECGGFLYLHETLDGLPMAGVIPGQARRTSALQRFGYATLRAEADNLLLEAGQCLRVHEFHYWDSDNNGSSLMAAKAGSDRSWPCVHASPSLWAGFPHLYFPALPVAARRFVAKAAQYRQSTAGGTSSTSANASATAAGPPGEGGVL